MRGHSLIELLFVMTLMGVAVTALAPAARRQRDRAQVVGAREAVVALLAEARTAAMERGSATVHVATDPAFAEGRAAGVPLRRVALADEFGVTVTLGGAASDADLSYDALGIGRLASQTITFRRGHSSSELVVSGYGRVRRQ
ncbi:MAG: Tfp pilus assembly protein FimT/FimU [Gemmatimonadales bacterium]